MGIGLAVAAVLVAANGFFVGAEFSIARLRPTQVDDYVRQGRAGPRTGAHSRKCAGCNAWRPYTAESSLGDGGKEAAGRAVALVG